MNCLTDCRTWTYVIRIRSERLRVRGENELIEYDSIAERMTDRLEELSCREISSSDYVGYCHRFIRCDAGI
jgi:hypothetical protein